jgi:L-cysteine desulfidase
MTVYADLGAWALATLKLTSSVTVLVVGGAANIVESGELHANDLQDAQEARRASADQARVLAIVVMDTGETGGQKRTASCSVFVYDRRAGYGNIRSAREAVISALVNQPVVLSRNASIVQVGYRGRTGHEQFQDFDLDFERVDFAGPLALQSRDEYA